MRGQLIAGILKRNELTGAVSKIESGRINSVYAIGETHVLKIENTLDVVAHQPVLIKIAFDAGAKVPRVIDSGTEEGKGYMLMTRLPGRTVAQDWLVLDQHIQNAFIRQIVRQLRIFHSVRFLEYALPRPQTSESWAKVVDAYTRWEDVDESTLDAATLERFCFLRTYYNEHKHVLNTVSKPVLVHNDFHFENVLHADSEITGIVDFDFARQAPAEYELWHLLDFFATPEYFVEERLEDVYRGYDASREIQLFREYYPELFVVVHLIPKLKIYLMDSLISDLAAGATSKFNRRFANYFENMWLERNLGIGE